MTTLQNTQLTGYTLHQMHSWMRQRLAEADVRAQRAAPKSDVQGCYRVEAVEGVGMLVEPVNSNPYVFVLPDQVSVFASAPGSGTDRLRKRIEAALFFRSLCEARERELAFSGSAQMAGQDSNHHERARA